MLIKWEEFDDPEEELTRNFFGLYREETWPDGLFVRVEYKDVDYDVRYSEETYVPYGSLSVPLGTEGLEVELSIEETNYYFLFDDKTITLEDFAEKLNISELQVRDIEYKADQELYDAVRDDYEPPEPDYPY